MDFIYSLSKKIKYLALAFLVGGTLVGFGFLGGMSKVILAFLTVIIAVLGTIFVQYTSFKTNRKNLFLSTVIKIIALPSILVLGAILSLIYYPNLGIVVKIAAILVVAVFMYISELVNNIFLVVYEGGERIPLYRVASTWSQILMVVLTIPFYAGVFKIPINSIFQSLIVAVVSGLFTLYLVWVMNMDPEITNPSRGESLIESAMVFFIVFSLSISTSFIPAESFLRALFLSSALMSALGYMQAHHKNKINKKLIFEYFYNLHLFFLFSFLYWTIE